MIHFFVAGDPAPQGSKRIVQPKGHRRPLMIETSKKLGPWRTAVAAEALLVRQRLGRVLVEPLAVTLAFACRRPKRPRRPYPSLDADKLARAVFDSLKHGRLIHDDSQIVDVVVTKRWATTESGCHVSMTVAMLLAVLVLLVLPRPVVAETLRLRTEEHHIAIGDVVAHVGTDGATYAIDHGVMVPLAPEDVRITDRRARLTLPDRTLECALPVEALQEDRGRLQSRQGRAVRVVELFRRRTWLVDCPDGPGVIWDAFDRMIITTKGP